MKAHRPTIMGTRHMIAATQYLAAEAGFRILEAGGNAIDAGVACGIALGVVQPEFVNVAGVAPIIIYSAAGMIGSSPSPASAPGPGRLRAITSRSITAARFAGRLADRGAGGARCLDHGARALRHHELRRGCAVRHRLCAQRLSRLPADVRDHRRARGRVPRFSVECCALSAEGCNHRSREGSCRRRSPPCCSTWRTRRARRAIADARPPSRRRAMPSIAATSHRRSSRFQKENGGLSVVRRSRELSFWLRCAGRNRIRRDPAICLRALVPRPIAAAGAQSP